KNYVDFRLEVHNKGGHSSRPVKDNAIYHLAGGLMQLGAFDFPVMTDDTTRGFFERSAAFETPENTSAFRAIVKNPQDQQAAAQISKSPYLNALLRTTCVATRLERSEERRVGKECRQRRLR